MSRYALVMLALAAGRRLPGRSGGVHLRAGTSTGVWNSNVLRRATRTRKPTYSVRTGPTLRVREPQGDLTYDLSYQILYEAYADESERHQQLRSVRSARGVLGHHARTRAIEASDVFAYVSSLNSLVETTRQHFDRDAETLANPHERCAGGYHASARTALADQRLGRQPALRLPGPATRPTRRATTGTLQLTRSVLPTAGCRRGCPVPATGVRGRSSSESGRGTDLLPGLRPAELQHQSHLAALGAGGSGVGAARRRSRSKNVSPPPVPHRRSQHLPDERRGNARLHPVPAEPRRPLPQAVYRSLPRQDRRRHSRPRRPAATSHSSAIRTAVGSLNYFGRDHHREGLAPVARHAGILALGVEQFGAQHEHRARPVPGHADVDPDAASGASTFTASYSMQSPVNEVRQREVLLRTANDVQIVNGGAAPAVLRRPVRGGHGRADRQRRRRHHLSLRADRRAAGSRDG